MHVELTNGQSAELRDPETLTQGDVDGFTASLPMPQMNGSEIVAGTEAAYGVEVKNKIIAYAILSWTFTDEAGAPIPIPSEDPNSWGRLRAADGKILRAKGNDFEAVLMPDFAPSPDPASPTPPSNA